MQFDGLFSRAGLSWTPDNKRILFDGLVDPNNDLMYRRSHIYAIDVVTGVREMLTDSIGDWTDPWYRLMAGVVYSGYPEAKETMKYRILSTSTAATPPI